MEIDITKIKYRRTNIEDLNILVDYRIRFLNESGIRSEDEETKELKKALRKYYRIAIPPNEFICWLVEYRDKILGVSGMVVYQVPGRYGFVSGKLGFICNMYTVPKARRRGISTRLLSELVKEAKSLGLEYLHLRAHKDAINIYRRAGFTEPFTLELQLKLK